LCLGRAVDTIFGDLGVNVYIRNTIFRKAPPSVVFGYGKRSINLNKVVATFEKHICQLEPSLAGMFLGWSSTNFRFFVPI
jgi:hypothetical protein